MDGLYAILYGKSPYPNRLTNSGKEEGDEEIVFLFYLVKFENRIILIDTGISSRETGKKNGIQDWISPDKILLKAGVSPKSITEIILTHYHFDHAGGLDLFPNAKIYIRPSDWESLKRSDWFPGLKRNLLDKEKTKKVVLLESSLEIFSNFRILFTGGHTAGSVAVEWFRDRGQRILITGDECYWIEHCVEGTGLPPAAAYSIRNNKEFLDYLNLLASQGTRILTMHDPAVLFDAEEISPRIFKLY